MAKDVLLIAADGALRRSLEFLFETEGIETSSHSDLSLAIHASRERSRCVVVDESALGSGHDHWVHLSSLAESIVVLLGRAFEVPTDLLIRAVQKPLMGTELIEIVKDLLSGNDTTA